MLRGRADAPIQSESVPPSAAPTPPPALEPRPIDAFTLAELLAAFLEHAQQYYVKDGEQTSEYALGAMMYYGLSAIEAAEKEQMRHLAMRGGDYTSDERAALLDYCQSDVDALAKLLPAMLHLGDIDLPRALLRGRYMLAAARMEWAGTPIDTPARGKQPPAGAEPRSARDYGLT